MRKWCRRCIALILFVIIVLALTTACGDKDRIKSRLIDKQWYRMVGGNYNLEMLYVFSEDGTFTCVTSDSSIATALYGPTVSSGTYSIDTKNNIINWKYDGESENHEFYYSFENGLFRLFNGSGKEFTNLGPAN